MRRLSSTEEEAVYALAEQITGSSQKGRSRKTVLVQNVVRRMALVGAPSLTTYLALVERDASELEQLVSALTIHHTAFFREPEHFDLVLRELAGAQSPAAGGLRILSAACSSGEEAYSLAMVLESRRAAGLGPEYRIVGVDIDPVSVAKAAKAIYRLDREHEIPAAYRRFVVKGVGRATGYFTLSPEIRRRTAFYPADLRGLQVELARRGEAPFDAVICRNVLIYFDAQGVTQVVRNLTQALRPGGVLCLGHSEVIEAAPHGLEARGRALYRLPAAPDRTEGPKGTPARGRILVVDDSPSIRKVLAELLRRAGFAVETAESAAAADRVLERTAVDGVTLDLGMPEVDGATWLRRQRAKGFRAPVVIVSATSPAEAEELFGALVGGAQDYVEKQDLHQAPERIAERIGAIVAHGSGRRAVTPAPAAGRQARQRPQRFRPDLLVVGASTGGTEALVKLLGLMPAGSPPVLVVQHISASFAKPFAERLARAAGLTLGAPTDDAPLEPGHLYMAQGDYHIGVKRGRGELRLQLSQHDPEHSVRPAVDFLFRTAAASRARIVGALLTGMGRDGAAGLLDLASAGALTLAQDEASCVVFGMPLEAMRLGAAQVVGDLTALRREIDLCLSA